MAGVGIDPLSIAQAGVGVIQTIGGLIGKSKARKKMERLMAQRKAFQTPEEVTKMLQATQSNAQAGLGDEVLNYLTTNADRAMSSSIGAASLLGADPNSVAKIFEIRNMENMKIGSMNHAQKLEQFSTFLNAMNTMAENKAAEQISKDNLIKDQMQAASGQAADSMSNISGGINSIFGAISAERQMKLFGDNSNQLQSLIEAILGSQKSSQKSAANGNATGTGGFNAATVAQAVGTLQGIQNIPSVGALPGVNG